MKTFHLTLFAALLIFSYTSNHTTAEEPPQMIRIGIIGLDTSHSIHFTRTINSENPLKEFAGCRIVAAYPHGSKTIESSYSRIPKYTEEIKTYGVEIVDSIESLLEKVDCVLLETNDGRPHLEQVIPVLKAGKRVFVDKPVAGSLVDAIAIYQASEKLKVPVFSSSSLRFTNSAKEICGGSLGEILGADSFSPCPIEETHPDLFWYGIHGVETLFTVMGPGCDSVVRIHTDDCDVVVGTWKDGRIGTFRGRRGKNGKYMGGYGGTAFGTKGSQPIGGFSGYEPLLIEIVKFFRTGEPPVTPEETLEIYAFMEAADQCLKQNGLPVSLPDYMESARKEAETILEVRYRVK